MEKFLSDEQIANMLDRWDSEDDLDLAAPTNFESEYEDSASEYNSHRSDTEMELDSHDESNASSDDEGSLSHLASYTGKNGFKWSKTPPPASRTRAHNLIRHLPGIKGPALSNDNLNPLECWKVIFTRYYRHLVDQLKAKELTYVGTLSKKKREFVKEFLPSKWKRIVISVKRCVTRQFSAAGRCSSPNAICLPSLEDSCTQSTNKPSTAASSPRQSGLAIRGHEDEHSNYIRLLNLRSEDIPELKKHGSSAANIVSICTAERLFSALRRIKTYLRSIMTQQRLDDQMIVHVNREIADDLDLEEIADIFINRAAVR
ncbi:hypothetical protein EVAR_12575_1 [Eumeta japonica]|uniref:HAT C-terminal dimerisation domain-containing protein n=1 Tax=Eumeta variegata TaxID=151549 RepID=A0A4C1UEN1_EUMVA|nr:hypothetical protein EVAR_12575_1 [Eumeta japonica]